MFARLCVLQIMREDKLEWDKGAHRVDSVSDSELQDRSVYNHNRQEIWCCSVLCIHGPTYIYIHTQRKTKVEL